MLPCLVVFSLIFETKLEALLPEESVGSEEKGFENAVRVLKMRDYDFLDFRNTSTFSLLSTFFPSTRP